MQITPFLGEVIILLLMAVCCLRTYFIKNTRLDSLSIFAPLTLILSVLQIINWGFNIGEILLLLIAFIVFCVNYRSLIKFCYHLYIDSYSTAFIIGSSFCLALIIFAAVIFSINIPCPLSPKKYQVNVKSDFYSKQDDGTYKIPDKLFASKTLKLTVYSPAKENPVIQKNTVVLFVPDKRAGFESYEPYLVLLAKNGYKVYCGFFDFSTVEGTSKYMPGALLQRNLIHSVRKADSDIQYFNSHPEYYDAHAKEFEILTKIADDNESVLRNFVIVGDGASGNCFDRIKNPARTIAASFSLSSVDEYKTSGYGFIQQTDPLYASFRYKLKKDKNSFVSSYAVMKTKNVIEAVK